MKTKLCANRLICIYVKLLSVQLNSFRSSKLSCAVENERRETESMRRHSISKKGYNVFTVDEQSFSFEFLCYFDAKLFYYMQISWQT